LRWPGRIQKPGIYARIPNADLARDLCGRPVVQANKVAKALNQRMNTFTPPPQFDYYYKACRKGDLEAKSVAVNQSPVAVLATASEITGLPRDNFEVLEIAKTEFDALPLADRKSGQ
jgi:hypothetical protein